MQEVTVPYYETLHNLIRNLSPNQVLFQQKYDFIGLDMCVNKGANLDPVPEPKVHFYQCYYEWAAWKNWTLYLQRVYPIAGDQELFHYYAMLTYIEKAHDYLRVLDLVKSQDNQ